MDESEVGQMVLEKVNGPILIHIYDKRCGWKSPNLIWTVCVCTQYLSLVQNIQLIHDTDGVPQIMYIPKNMLCLIVKKCNLNSHACHVD